MTTGTAPLESSLPQHRESLVPTEWLKASFYFAGLRDRLPLDDDEWHDVAEWLIATDFDDRSYLAAEVAAGLVRDFGTESFKVELADRLPIDRWHQHVRRIIAGR